MDIVEGLPLVEVVWVVVVGSLEDDEEEEEEEEAVIRVLITQIGFVMRTVAEPARAPQSMDSTVVRDLLARLVRRAARVKRERVHSYPLFLPSIDCELVHVNKRVDERRGQGGKAEKVTEGVQ